MPRVMKSILKRRQRKSGKSKTDSSLLDKIAVGSKAINRANLSCLPIMNEEYYEKNSKHGGSTLKRAKSLENLAEVAESIMPRARLRRAAKEKVKSYDEKYGILRNFRSFKPTFKVYRGHASEEEFVPKFCHCRNSRKDFKELLVECSNDICRYEWFHLTCVGLTSPPHGTWYCPGCRQFPRNTKIPRLRSELQRILKDYNEKGTDTDTDSDDGNDDDMSSGSDEYE